MRRSNQRFRFLMAVTLMVAALSLCASPVSGQALRTPWGDPDLQGIWSNPYVTPLERPKQFGNREFLTKEEIASEEKRLRELAQGPGRDDRQGTGTEKDVARAYNEHWFGDPSLLRGTRTSLIIDPPDGRGTVQDWDEEGISLGIAARHIGRKTRADIATPIRTVSGLQPRSNESLRWSGRSRRPRTLPRNEYAGAAAIRHLWRCGAHCPD